MPPAAGRGRGAAAPRGAAGPQRRWSRSRLPAAGRAAAQGTRWGRTPGFLPPAHLGAGRRREPVPPSPPPGRGHRQEEKDRERSGVVGGRNDRGGRSRQRRRGAWSATAPRRCSRKRWKRGWTITETSPTLTLLGKRQGKTGAATDRGRSFLPSKRSLFHFPLPSPKKIKKEKSRPPPSPPPPSKEQKPKPSSSSSLRLPPERTCRRFSRGVCVLPPAWGRSAAGQRLPSARSPAELPQPRRSLPRAFTSLFCVLPGLKQSWATSREQQAVHLRALPTRQK